MKSQLYKDPLKKLGTELAPKRLAPKNGWGVFIVLVAVALGLLGGYLMLGAIGLLFVGFVVIVASSSPLQADHILAALSRGATVERLS
ncbi:MAG: hypothetical protein QM758_24000 [Armatimonas sp.]